MQSLLVLLAADTRLLFRDGKLYAVAAIVLIIWAGIVLLLLRQEKRLKRLEKQLENRAADA